MSLTLSEDTLPKSPPWSLTHQISVKTILTREALTALSAACRWDGIRYYQDGGGGLNTEGSLRKPQRERSISSKPTKALIKMSSREL